jgi:hypothetical protein
MISEEFFCLCNIAFIGFHYFIFSFPLFSVLNCLLSCREDANDPYFWSRICVNNMAKLSREATTFRRVMESLFSQFDNTNSWPSQNGLALCVLLDMQILMESSGAPFASCHRQLKIDLSRHTTASFINYSYNCHLQGKTSI